MPTSVASSFGELLLHHRVAAGLSQHAVAVRSGLSERAVRDLERGVTARPRVQSVRALAKAIGVAGDELTTFLAAARWQPTASVLETPPGEFVGRRFDLTALADLVTGRRYRLITVTGPGGVGKSRLAAELVAALRRQHGLDIRTLDLSAVIEPELVTERLAEALGVGAGRAPAVDRIAIRLGTERLVVVLDGMERVLHAGAQIATLVRRCAGLTVLTTSQRPLNVRGERVARLAPLPMPEAVELFALRAADFVVTQENRATVEAICRAVDGLPLALELAAARLRVLAPEELADRLSRPLRVLTDGARDLPARHRSLRATIEASLAAVSPAARTVFATLAPFPAGARLIDLERVHPDPLSALTELAESSLLRVRRADDTTRYLLADPMRELAQELLAQRPNATGIQREVTATFLDRLRNRTVGADADNVRAALLWAQQHQPDLLDFQTIEAFYRYCEQHGHFVEGRNRLIAMAEAGAAAAAWALVAAGSMSRLLKDRDEAERLVRRAQALPHDHTTRSAAELLLGSIAVERGELAEAIANTTAALATARAAGDEYTAGRALHNLGTIAVIGLDPGRAGEYFRDALAAKRRAGARDNDLGLTLMNLADLELAERHWRAAADHAAEAAAQFERGGHGRYQALSLSTVAIAKLASGHPDAASGAIELTVKLLDAFGEERPHRSAIQARASIVRHACGQRDQVLPLLREGLDGMHGSLTQFEMAPVIEAHAAIVAERYPAVAARLLGLAEAIRSHQDHPQPVLLDEVPEILTRCRAALGESIVDELARGAGLYEYGIGTSAATLLAEALVPPAGSGQGTSIVHS